MCVVPLRLRPSAEVTMQQVTKNVEFRLNAWTSLHSQASKGKNETHARDTLRQHTQTMMEVSESLRQICCFFTADRFSREDSNWPWPKLAWTANPKKENSRETKTNLGTHDLVHRGLEEPRPNAPWTGKNSDVVFVVRLTRLIPLLALATC